MLRPAMSSTSTLSSMLPVCVAHKQGYGITVTICLQNAHAESDALLPQAR